MNISGRVALVTGASQGIGRSCALKLASTGATVALAARSQEKLDELAREITAAGGKAAALSIDRDHGRYRSAAVVRRPDTDLARGGSPGAGVGVEPAG